MMDNETFLSSSQAKDFGFVDEVQEALKVVAYFDLKKIKPEKTMEDTIKELFTKFEIPKLRTCRTSRFLKTSKFEKRELFELRSF